MKKFLKKLSFYKTPIIFSIVGLVLLAGLSFAVRSVFFTTKQDGNFDNTTKVMNEKSNDEPKKEKKNSTHENTSEEVQQPDDPGLSTQKSSDTYQPTYTQEQDNSNYDAEKKRIDDEYNETMKRIEEEYEASRKNSEEELKRIDEEYNSRMKQIEEESKTRESEEKLQQALEEARRMEEQARIEAENLCPNTHAQSYAQYEQTVQRANNTYNSTVANIKCSAFGGCPQKAEAARERDSAISSAQSLYKSSMQAAGCNPSDYVDW